MTTYRFLNKVSLSSGLTYPLFWDNPQEWDTGVVPNSSDADVVIEGLGGFGFPTSTITGSESFLVRSLRLERADFQVNGQLSVLSAIDMVAHSSLIITAGATVNAGSFSNTQPNSVSGGSVTGGGTFNVSGTLTNNDLAGADGMTINAGSLFSTGILGGRYTNITTGTLTNLGTLVGFDSTVTVTGGAGTFTNLSNGTLTDGTYDAVGDTLNLNVGGTITTDAAVIILENNAVLNTFDPVTNNYLPLQATLTTIAAGGDLSLQGAQNFAAINAVTLAGTVVMNALNSAVTTSITPTLSTAGLTITETGLISGAGTISGPVVNNGTIISGLANQTTSSEKLTLTGSVTGSGRLVVGNGNFLSYSTPFSTLELTAASSVPVVFADGTGVLMLDNPAAFTGTITPAATETLGYSKASNDQVVLANITAQSVTGYSFTPTTGGGILTVQEGATQQSLSFLGNLSRSSFRFAPSASGNDLDITVTLLAAPPTVALEGQASNLAKTILNTAIPSFNGISAAGTTVQVSVNGVAAGKTNYSSTLGTAGITYSAVSPTLALGAQHLDVAAIATNNAGSSNATTSLDAFVASTATDNHITNSPFSSFDIKPLRDDGYAYTFRNGTEVQFTNGTVSEDPDAYLAIVQRLYVGLLGRSGDAGGLAYFNNQLAGGTSPDSVAATIIGSAEYRGLHGAVDRTSSDFVDLLYQNALGRAADADGRRYWTSELEFSYSPEPGRVAVGFTSTAESKTHLAAYTADVWAPDAQGSLVTQLYLTGLSRDPDLAGLQSWKDQLSAGLSPTDLANAIAGSAEFQSAHTGQNANAFVSSLYSAGLGRPPDAGAQYWVSQVQSGSGWASALYGIATSAEASARLSPVI